MNKNMPDALAHYAVSYLVASRVTKPKYALFIALIGLLPDIDVLLRVHRWVTHSLIPVALVASATAVILLYTRRSYLKYLALATTLYILHIALDIFVAPTPLLWPLTSQAYMLDITLSSTITEDGIVIDPQIAIITNNADFTRKPAIDGSLVSTTGVIIAIGVIAIIIIEELKNYFGFEKQ